MFSDLNIRVVSCLNPFLSISFLAVLPSHDKLNPAFIAEATGSFLVVTRAIVDLGNHKGREGHSDPQEITDCRGVRSILSWCWRVIDSVQTLHEWQAPIFNHISARGSLFEYPHSCYRWLDHCNETNLYRGKRKALISCPNWLSRIHWLN